MGVFRCTQVSMGYSSTLALLQSSVIKDGNKSKELFLSLKWRMSSRIRRPIFGGMLSKIYAVIWTLISKAYVRLMHREIQIQMVSNQIWASTMKSCNDIPIFVVANGTSLPGYILSASQLPDHNSSIHMTLCQYLVAHICHLYAPLQSELPSLGSS